MSDLIYKPGYNVLNFKVTENVLQDMGWMQHVKDNLIGYGDSKREKKNMCRCVHQSKAKRDGQVPSDQAY